MGGCRTYAHVQDVVLVVAVVLAPPRLAPATTLCHCTPEGFGGVVACCLGRSGDNATSLEKKEEERKIENDH